MSELTQRERLRIPRQGMPEQDPVARGENFDEVALGFTMELARQLSGVTMQEPGVSRLVSVDLDAAVKMAAS